MIGMKRIEREVDEFEQRHIKGTDITLKASAITNESISTS